MNATSVKLNALMNMHEMMLVPVMYWRGTGTACHTLFSESSMCTV